MTHPAHSAFSAVSAVSYGAPRLPGRLPGQRHAGPAGPRAADAEPARESDPSCPGCAMALGQHLHLRLAPAPEEVGRARRAVRASLTDWGCSDRVLDDCALLTSELVGNAIRHGPAAPLVLTVDLLLLIDMLLLGVTDASPAHPELRPAGPDDETGRGLHLIQALATEWGVYRSTTHEKTTWCAVELTADAG
ncbi:ATP-binding protein [Streptomyces sp. B6B3]|uniref:ATP-binding protein n=1 Tax=Streptomyces sp. B6B3 TaxID=3153570 RepID=UPI00325D0793